MLSPYWGSGEFRILMLRKSIPRKYEVIGGIKKAA